MRTNHPTPIQWLKIVSICVAVIALFSFAAPARADVAPPQQPPGANLEPGTETTQVRMVDEVVTLDVLAEEPAHAHVTANFSMRNLGSQAESMAVRFPLGAESEFYDIQEIQNFGVRVNEKPVSFQRVVQETEIYGQKVQMPWATFQVTFPPGEDVFIKVSYDLTGTAWEYDNYVEFSYTLETGAGWKESIGSAVIIVRLPYEASELNVLDLHANPAMSGIQGREASWAFSDLEPTAEDNFTVFLVKPVIWKAVVEESRNVAGNPKDGEAWGRLGKAYKQSFTYPKPFCREDGTSEELYALSKQAYEKAVTLKPEDALWHAGFADLLAQSGQWGCPDTPGDRVRALQEIKLALDLAPNDAKVQELADIVSFRIQDGMVKTDGGYDFPWLTQTPAPTATPAPTDVMVVVSETSKPPVPAVETPVQPATPVPNPINAPCGTALILPLLAAGLFLWRRV